MNITPESNTLKMCIRDIYIHGGDIYKYDNKILDFSANINPLGMPDTAKNAIINGIDKYEAYPDYSSRQLRNALSIRCV